jgi:Domain of unknown function (DUF397)
MTEWRTSRRSNGGQCVEVAVAEPFVLVRDSKARSEAVLKFTFAEWEAFVGGVRDGEFDLLSFSSRISS